MWLLIRTTHANINSACLVTTNNGLKRHQMVLFEPKVCLLFFSIQFLIFYLAFVRHEEVLGGRGKGQWWLGPNDVSGVIWALDVYHFISFNLLEPPGPFFEPPEPCFEPGTPFQTPGMFLNAGTSFQTLQTLPSNPRPHVKLLTRFWTHRRVFKPPDVFWNPILSPGTFPNAWDVPDPPFKPQTRFRMPGPLLNPPDPPFEPDSKARCVFEWRDPFLNPWTLLSNSRPNFKPQTHFQMPGPLFKPSKPSVQAQTWFQRPDAFLNGGTPFWTPRPLFWTLQTLLSNSRPHSKPQTCFWMLGPFSNPPDPPFKPQAHFQMARPLFHPPDPFSNTQTLVSNPPDPPFKLQTPFQTPDMFWTPGLLLESPGPRFEPQVHFWMLHRSHMTTLTGQRFHVTWMITCKHQLDLPGSVWPIRTVFQPTNNMSRATSLTCVQAIVHTFLSLLLFISCHTFYSVCMIWQTFLE